MLRQKVHVRSNFDAIIRPEDALDEQTVWPFHANSQPVTANRLQIDHELMVPGTPLQNIAIARRTATSSFHTPNATTASRSPESVSTRSSTSICHGHELRI